MSIDRAKALKAAQKYLAKGQIDRAISEFEKMVADDPRDARSLLKLGDLYTRKGDTRGASNTYRKVATQYAQQGFFLKAVAVFKQILKLDPNDLAAIESLAEMYEKLSLASDALATYEQVVDAYARAGKPDKAVAALGKLASLDPQNVASWIRYAEALSKADMVDEAADAFRRGADLLKEQGRADDYIKVTERLLYHAHDVDRARELAQMYIDRGLGKAALPHLQTCFKADPRDLRTLELLARAFAQIGQSVKAVSVYKEIARIHAEAGNGAQEQEALRALLSLDGGDTEAQRRLETLSIAPREESQSIELVGGDEDLEEVVVVDEEASAAAQRRSAPPLEEWEREAQIARLMAECEVFLRYSLRDKVVAQLKRVLEIDPRHIEAREKLKDALLKQSNVNSAVTQLRMLAEIVAPEDVARAREYLDEAQELAPNDAEVQRQIGALSRKVPSVAPEDEDELIILDDDETLAATSAPEQQPALGPRETSLATALEGPGEDDLGDEPELVFEDDEEPAELDDAVELEADPRETLDDDEAPAIEASYDDEDDELEAREEPEDDEDLPSDIAEAIEEADFYIAQKLSDEAREVLNDSLAANPKHPALLRKLAELDGGRTSEMPVPPPPKREDKSFALAQKLAEQASAAQGPVAVEQVLQQFKEGVRRQVDPGDSATHYDLGIAYMEMGLHAEAIDAFKLCLGDRQKDCMAHTMLGLSYVAKGDMQLGIDHFKRALQSPACKPEEELDLWFEIGNAYELLGKQSEALVFYEKVEERNPAFRDVAARIERLGHIKSPQQETDEFDAMFDNMIIKE